MGRAIVWNLMGRANLGEVQTSLDLLERRAPLGRRSCLLTRRHFSAGGGSPQAVQLAKCIASNLRENRTEAFVDQHASLAKYTPHPRAAPPALRICLYMRSCCSHHELIIWRHAASPSVTQQVNTISRLLNTQLSFSRRTAARSRTASKYTDHTPARAPSQLTRDAPRSKMRRELAQLCPMALQNGQRRVSGSFSSE